MVSCQYARASQGTMEDALRKAAGTLPVLWCHLQLSESFQFLVECQMVMAEMARVACPRQSNVLGTLREAAGTLSTAEAEDMPFRSLANPSFRGTVCVNRARTGLWGLRMSNHPFLPGRSGLLPPTHACSCARDKHVLGLTPNCQRLTLSSVSSLR